MKAICLPSSDQRGKRDLKAVKRTGDLGRIDDRIVATGSLPADSGLAEVAFGRTMCCVYSWATHQLFSPGGLAATYASCFGIRRPVELVNMKLRRSNLRHRTTRHIHRGDALNLNAVLADYARPRFHRGERTGGTRCIFHKKNAIVLPSGDHAISSMVPVTCVSCRDSPVFFDHRKICGWLLCSEVQVEAYASIFPSGDHRVIASAGRSSPLRLNPLSFAGSGFAVWLKWSSYPSELWEDHATVFPSGEMAASMGLRVAPRCSKSEPMRSSC